MKTYEELSEEYDKLYKRAELFIKKYNPCKIVNGRCARAQRCGQNFCCDGCQHLTSKGCSIKSLTCKVWFHCGYANYKVLMFKEYKELERDSSLFFCHRGTKEDSIKKALFKLNGGVEPKIAYIGGLVIEL